MTGWPGEDASKQPGGELQERALIYDLSGFNPKPLSQFKVLVILPPKAATPKPALRSEGELTALVTKIAAASYLKGTRI